MSPPKRKLLPKVKIKTQATLIGARLTKKLMRMGTAKLNQLSRIKRVRNLKTEITSMIENKPKFMESDIVALLKKSLRNQRTKKKDPLTKTEYNSLRTHAINQMKKKGYNPKRIMHFANATTH